MGHKLIPMSRIGFVGVGAISEAVIDGLLTGPNADSIHVVLSPRSTERSSRIAHKYSQATIASSNQEVVDASDVVIFGVLPSQMVDVCTELDFRADQIVVSLIAGMPPRTVADIVAPATSVAQMIPLPFISIHTGPIVLCPGILEIADLFRGCGDLVVLDDEKNILALSCASAAMSSFFEFQNTAINWTAGKGIPLEVAHQYMSSLFKGLATESMQSPVSSLPDMPVEHETPGGLNESVRHQLLNAGMFNEFTAALEHIYVTRNRAKD